MYILWWSFQLNFCYLDLGVFCKAYIHLNCVKNMFFLLDMHIVFLLQQFYAIWTILQSFILIKIILIEIQMEYDF